MTISTQVRCSILLNSLEFCGILWHFMKLLENEQSVEKQCVEKQFSITNLHLSYRIDLDFMDLI